MQILFNIFMDIVFTIYYFVLLAIAGVGYVINNIGYSISALGQLLMKVDPLR